jgi:polysaccharide export outer membrane protein
MRPATTIAGEDPLRSGELISVRKRVITKAMRFMPATLLLMALVLPSAWAEPTGSPVGVGDVLQITVFAGGEKQEDFTATVASAGSITCPLLGEARIKGMTTDEIAKLLRTMFAKDYFVDPQVLVSVKEYGGQVYVTGEVKSPGAYGIKDGLTVLHACLLAGGFTDFASLRAVKLTRSINGQSRTAVVDIVKVRQGKEADPPVMGGDRLEVPRRRF